MGAGVVNGCVRTDHVQIPIVELPDVPYYAIHRRPDDPRVSRFVEAMVKSVRSASSSRS